MERQDHPSSSERWQQVEALFAATLDRPPDERTTFLDAACSDHPDLRVEVESLLAHYNRAGDFLEDLDAAQASALLDAIEELHEEERRIGPYRTVRELGRGGMGAVYLAERTDGQFEQKVALKLIKRGMDSDAILRRFLIERQILARLQHATVARLLDGGISDDGQPYFAMEYIEGVPITSYCDRHRLSVSERLRLFQQICHAVQYAHRNLVVHRDLKPSNILVTETGEVKLLDFGIAKLLDDETGAGEATWTGVGLRAMTPEYAAPEQIRGEPVTTATDVYALGVILYELLTGHRPYQFERRTPEAVARVLAEVEPERLSTMVSRTEELRHADGATETITPDAVSQRRATQPARLKRRLSGDLDNIVLKALRKEPERRYASAEAFLEDLRRHLVGLPVQASKDTLAYRAAKFIRRHKVGVVAAALVILALGLGLAGTAWQAREAARERDLARQEADKAARVSHFMVDLFQMADPNHARGETVTVRELLDSGRVWIDRELLDQPELRATMMFYLGEVYYGLGRYDQARQLWESTLAVQLEIYGEGHPDIPNTMVYLAKALEDLGQYEAAEEMARRSLILRRRLPDEKNQSLARIMSMMARSLYHQDKYEEAESTLREALDLFPAPNPEDPHDRTVIVNTMAHVLRAQGDHAAAESLYRDILAIRRAWWGVEHPEVAQTLTNLASVLGDQDHYVAAESLFYEGLAMRQKLQGADHPDVAIDKGRLAALLHQQGDLEAAATVYREALEQQRQALPAGHPHLVITLVNLGNLLLEQDRPQAAEALLREALEIQEQALPERHWRRAEAQSALGACLSAMGRFEEAESLLLGAYNGLKETRGERAPATRRVLQHLVAHYERRGLPEHAAAYAAHPQFTQQE